MAFRKVATVDDLWSGDDVYAYEDCCAHLGVCLSRGTLAGGVLTCSAHEWQYDIATGRGVNPASAFLRPFPVKVEARQIFVDLPEDEPGE
jgi:toluene monooxygenase system ferredoxin subunit